MISKSVLISCVLLVASTQAVRLRGSSRLLETEHVIAVPVGADMNVTASNETVVVATNTENGDTILGKVKTSGVGSVVNIGRKLAFSMSGRKLAFSMSGRKLAFSMSGRKLPHQIAVPHGFPTVISQGRVLGPHLCMDVFWPDECSNRPGCWCGHCKKFTSGQCKETTRSLETEHVIAVPAGADMNVTASNETVVVAPNTENGDTILGKVKTSGVGSVVNIGRKLFLDDVLPWDSPWDF